MKTLPAIGTWVRLKKDKRWAPVQVSSHMDQKHYPGGIRLDRAIEGFRYWNMEDVEKCAPPSTSSQRKEKE